MPRLAAVLAVLAALALPASAGAHRHHVRHHHVHAHRSTVTGCETPEDHTWVEWRRDMASAGFDVLETEELEVCDDADFRAAL
jgi:hypothetical protein